MKEANQASTDYAADERAANSTLLAGTRSTQDDRMAGLELPRTSDLELLLFILDEGTHTVQLGHQVSHGGGHIGGVGAGPRGDHSVGLRPQVAVLQQGCEGRAQDTEASTGHLNEHQ